MEEFYSIITKGGNDKITSLLGGGTVTLAEFAVGDGNGAYYDPNEEQTTLARELWRGDIASIAVDPKDSTRRIVSAYIPANVGGWWIREAGLYTNDSPPVLFAVAKIPAREKVDPVSGSAVGIYIKMYLEANSAKIEVVPGIDVIPAVALYDPEREVYNANESVSFLGSVYVCIIPTTAAGQDPLSAPTHWQLISSKGDKGDPGDVAVSTAEAIASAADAYNYKVEAAASAAAASDSADTAATNAETAEASSTMAATNADASSANVVQSNINKLAAANSALAAANSAEAAASFTAEANAGGNAATLMGWQASSSAEPNQIPVHDPSGVIRLMDIIGWGPEIDVRAFMDGQSGRPTLAAWQASQITNDIVDVTLCIQAALDLVPQRPVAFCPGTFWFTKLNIHSLSRMKGSAMRLTKLKAIASSEPWAFTMDRGAVTGVDIRDFEIDGNAANLTQGGFYLYAQAPLTGYVHGGLWYSTIKNITMSGFNGHGIWLRGGQGVAPYQYQFPNQFNVFENVNVFKGANANANNARSLLITGQCAQHTFLNCEFDGTWNDEMMGVGVNVELSREFVNGSVVGGASVGGAAVGDNAPSGAVNFITSTFQGAEKAFLIDRGGCNILGCWFENLYRAITIATSSVSTKVRDCHFANAGSDGNGGGYIISVTGSTSYATFEDNRITGAFDKIISNATNFYGLRSRGNILESDAYGKTAGMTRQIGDYTPGTLDFKYHTSVLVNATANDITTLNSYLVFGDDITIRIGSGSGSVVRFVAGGNITLANNTPLVLRVGDTATFTRMDLGAKWIVKAVVRAQSDASRNTGYGADAIPGTTVTGQNNSGFGYGAHKSITTANHNTAGGYNALNAMTTNSGSTAFGALAAPVATGTNVTAVGFSAALSTTTGNGVTALGAYALNSNTTGGYSVAAGFAALYSNTTGGYCVALGYNALHDNTTGDSSVAIGMDCLAGNTTGVYNVGIGRTAGKFQADGTTALTGANYSLYIGAGTRGTSNDYYTIVIGTNAISNGPHTATIGSADTLDTYLHGRVHAVTGGLAIETAGKGIGIKGGSNAKVGTAQLAAGTVTIANTSVSAASLIFIQRTGAVNGNMGMLTVASITAGASFTVTSTNNADTSNFNWWIVEQL